MVRDGCEGWWEASLLCNIFKINSYFFPIFSGEFLFFSYFLGAQIPIFLFFWSFLLLDTPRLCFYTCLSVHGGGGLPQCMLGYHPYPPPPGAARPQQMATAADGTHPTGMHSCFAQVLFFGVFFLGKKFFLKLTSFYQVILKQFDCSQPYICQ